MTESRESRDTRCALIEEESVLVINAMNELKIKKKQNKSIKIYFFKTFPTISILSKCVSTCARWKVER